MAKKTETQIKVTLVKSRIGSTKKQQSTLTGLGLRKMNRPSVLKDSPSVRGMIGRVAHLVAVEEA